MGPPLYVFTSCKEHINMTNVYNYAFILGIFKYHL
jgi:hypothetical protein